MLCRAFASGVLAAIQQLPELLKKEAAA
jgi:hypothetical protein